MKKIIIEALERPKKSGKFKEQGYVPGVLYGEGMDASASVKFNAAVMKNLIARHGSNAKIWVDYQGTKKFGLLKAVQTETLSNKLLNIDIQIIAKDQKMKLQVPINFIGDDILKSKELEFHVSRHETTVIGDMNLMPEAIEYDVSSLEVGDQVTYADFKLNDSLATDDPEYVYGVVDHRRIVAAEEPVEAETVKPV